VHQSSKADLQDSPVVKLERDIVNKQKLEETKDYQLNHVKEQDDHSTMLKDNGSESFRNMIPVNVGCSEFYV
jgi:hypothetical protein